MKDEESLNRHIFRLTHLGLSLVTGFFFVALLSTRLYHLSRYISYVIGLTGFWLGLPICLIFFLSCFVLGHKPKWLNIRLALGALVTLLGVSVIWAFAGNKGSVSFDFSFYNEAFEANKNTLFVNQMGGGLLGTLLAACFKATKVDALVYIFGSIILLLGLALAFWPLLIKLGKLAKANNAIRKSKKATKKAEEAKKKEEGEKASIAYEENEPRFVKKETEEDIIIPERPKLIISEDEPSSSRIEENIEIEKIYKTEKKPVSDTIIDNGLGPKEAIFIFEGKNNDSSSMTYIEEEDENVEIPDAKVEQERNPQAFSFEKEPESLGESDNEPIFEEGDATNATKESFDDSIIDDEESSIKARIEIPNVLDTPLVKNETASSIKKDNEIKTTPFPLAKPRPEYVLPGLDLLKDYDNEEAKEAQLVECESRAETINKVFQNLHIGAHVISYEVGPSVTRFNIETDDDVLPAVITKAVNKVRSALGGVLANYQESVIGSMYSALEIPNEKRMTVSLKEVVSNLPELTEKTRTVIPFGESISGSFYSADITEFPHMLVAGTTGSGKSVYNNSVILSLLMRNRPEDLKFVMVDPKQVEFMMYEDIPHLLCPIITDPKEAKVAVEKLTEEMERRNGIIRKAGVKKLSEYNKFAKDKGYETLPYIVLVVDEFADLMMNCKGIDELIARLAGKSRSAGIHMIICTQRPSVDVISGVIKANIPVRVALSVSSPTDSITILGEGGAENLAGYGDMLVTCGQVIRNSNFRAQGCFVDNEEIINVVNFIKSQQDVVYNPRFMDLSGKTENVIQSKSKTEYGMNAGADRDDPAYELVKNAVMHYEYYSMSKMNREFHFGYSRSGKIFQWLKEDGIIEDDDNKANSRGCKVLIRINDEMENPGSSDNSDFTPSSDPYDY